MPGPNHIVMASLDVFAVVSSLYVFARSGAPKGGVAAAGALLLLWLGVLHAALTRGWFPAGMSALAFLALVFIVVGAVGALLAITPARAAVTRLSQVDLLQLQGVRVLFGAAFFAQALTGALPRAFGLIDGITHMLAGVLALAAAAMLRRTPTATRLAWIANLWGITDIVVVLSSLSLVLLPQISPRHPMMYAVFLPAAFWACWHAVSILRLVRTDSAAVPAARERGNAGLLLLFLFAGLQLPSSGCRPSILHAVMKSVEPYFQGPDVDRVRLQAITGRVFSFQWNWYRNLVVLTDAGLVVIDPMGAPAAEALKEALAKQFPGVRVQRVIYSHYHLDHVRGAQVLEPAEVIAHEKCPTYWAPFEHDDVLPPTRLIAGDTDLSLGGVTIQALYLGLSHTDTLYAFYLPSERVVFTADLGLVRTVAPAGVPDRYAPGYLSALDRLIDLDFAIFVPSHFGYGRKQDLIDWRNMIEYGRALARTAIKKVGTFGAQDNQLGAYFDEIYFPMRKRYGDWHGFNEMAVLNIVRDIEGEGLGH